MDVRHNNYALKELNDCIGGLLHLGLNVITFRSLLHLGPNVITFRTLLHLAQLLHLGLQQGNPPSRGRFHEKKALKRNTYVLKLCTFPSRLMAEITRNRNEYTKSVKCSHFGIFGVVNRPYFVSQTILKFNFFIFLKLFFDHG